MPNPVDARASSLQSMLPNSVVEKRTCDQNSPIPGPMSKLAHRLTIPKVLQELFQVSSTLDIPWFKSITKMPIILKGVQRVEDVIRAIETGVQGVVLSNHGGRQLDFARSGIEVLAEVMPVLRERGWENRIEIFVDGGVRRATDIIKALCLGAKGVGIGRPFLYAMSAYGQPGVDRAMQLLKDEMEMNMRLIGCSNVDQLNPTLVDTRALSMHTTSVPSDTLVNENMLQLMNFFTDFSNRAYPFMIL
jgi:isopentenyl diphosphate isomerase/L-lactate dehydrogenase-like FMN-dependent dehydrogenase